MDRTTDQLLGEIAAILVALEEGRTSDAREMAEMIVGGSDFHRAARAEQADEDLDVDEGDGLDPTDAAVCEKCGAPCRYDPEICLCERHEVD